MQEGPFPNWRKRLEVEQEARQKEALGVTLGRRVTYCKPCEQDGHDLFKVPPGWSGIYNIDGPIKFICPCCTAKHPKVEVQQ